LRTVGGRSGGSSLGCRGKLEGDEGAADRAAVGLADGVVLEDVLDGVFEVVHGGRGALVAKGDVAVVDAAVVNLSELAVLSGPVLANKHGGFGGDTDVGLVNEVLRGVDEDGGFGLELLGVLGDDSEGVFGVGEDPVEGDALPGEFAGDTVDFGDRTVGDGAVGCGEEKNDDLLAGGGELGDGAGFEVGDGGLGEGRTGCG